MPPGSDAAYYQQIEEFFVSRRGDPLFLSSADWVLVHAWKCEGLPLRVVLRGIADALESHAHSWGRDRKVGSLRYCAAEVEVARERWQRALALGQEESATTGDALLAFAAALDAAALGPGARAIATELARELRARGPAGPERRDVEPWLAGAERRLVAALKQEAESGELAAAEAEVDASLEAYRERMPARILTQIRDEAVARRLLASRGLPRLSLVLT